MLFYISWPQYLFIQQCSFYFFIILIVIEAFRGLGLDEYLILIMHMLIVKKTKQFEAYISVGQYFQLSGLMYFSADVTDLEAHTRSGLNAICCIWHLCSLKYPETQNDWNAKNMLLRFLPLNIMKLNLKSVTVSKQKTSVAIKHFLETSVV